jgi:excisionase family DNA binding protein
MEVVYLTPKEAAYQMGVCINTFRSWIRRGVIKAEKKGPRLLYVPRSEVLRVKRAVIAK